MIEQTSPSRGVAGNGGKGLIEFVRKRSGELSHGRYPAHAHHFLTLQSQLEVGFDLRRDVDGHTNQLAYPAAIVSQVTAA